jgi:hypothetical protein
MWELVAEDKKRIINLFSDIRLGHFRQDEIRQLTKAFFRSGTCMVRSQNCEVQAAIFFFFHFILS